MREDAFRKTAKWAIVWSSLCLVVCLVRAATKPVSIVGTVQAQDQQAAVDADAVDASGVLVLSSLTESDGEADLVIPLPISVQSEGIQAENRYLSRQLWITLKTNYTYYDGSDQIRVNAERVREGAFVQKGQDALTLRFGLTGLYEPEMSLSESSLKIKLRTPGERYARVILVDPVPVPRTDSPASEAEEEEETQDDDDPALAVARDFAALYEDDPDTCVYLTRQGPARTQDMAVSMLQETQADYCIRLEILNDGVYGVDARYNDTWFLRNYTNARFACDLADGISAAAGCGILGVGSSDPEDPLLSVSEIPTASLTLHGVGNGAFTASEAAQGMADAMAASEQEKEE